MSGSAAFEREALPQLQALERFAYHLCRDSQNARDLVQETLLKAYTHFPSYREGSDCRAWLFRICRNSYLNERRRRLHHEIVVDFQDESTEPVTVDGLSVNRPAHVLLQDTADSDAYNRCLSDRLLEALQNLPAAYQTAVILSDIEDHPYQEVAELMRVPIGTVRSRIHRGRKILASLLLNNSPSSGRLQ